LSCELRPGHSCWRDARPHWTHDLTRVDGLREDIDYGDAPELDDDVVAQPLVPWPPKKEPITIRVDADANRGARRSRRP
jgi:hypothetical protein